MRLALTHYDILNVSRDAPQESIRAAYRSLCRKYHPDRNVESTDTTPVMAVINVSYDILSSPSKRRAYDDWLAEQESLHGYVAALLPSWEKLTQQVAPTILPLFPRVAVVMRVVQATGSHLWEHVGVYILAGLAMLLTILALMHPDGTPARLEFAPQPEVPPLSVNQLHSMSQPQPSISSHPELVLTKTAVKASPMEALGLPDVEH